MAFRKLSYLFFFLSLLNFSLAEEYFDKYDLTPNPNIVTLGVQPMAYPLAFISAVMLRDRILRQDLKEQNITLRNYRYKKGNDFCRLVGNGKIDMAFIGDLPTINAIITNPINIVGLGKRNFSSIISKKFVRLEELRGKKVGYSDGSSSHLVLLKGLKSVSMTDKDIILVPMEQTQMPDALESGVIDAYSGWEPIPSISLERDPKNRAIYRSMSTDWIVFGRKFASDKPKVAYALISSFVRALNWMRHSKEAKTLAAKWVQNDSSDFLGTPALLTAEKIIQIVTKDILEVPGAPSIPALVDGLPPLSREFAFLKERGKISAELSDDVVREAFKYTGLKEVQKKSKFYKLNKYDYDN